MADDQDRLGLAGAAQPHDDVLLLRCRTSDLNVAFRKPRGAQAPRHGFSGGCRAHAGLGGLDFDQFLEDVARQRPVIAAGARRCLRRERGNTQSHARDCEEQRAESARRARILNHRCGRTIRPRCHADHIGFRRSQRKPMCNPSSISLCAIEVPAESCCVQSSSETGTRNSSSQSTGEE